jgi:hypothetical protein
MLFILVPDSAEDNVKSWGFKYIKVDSLVKMMNMRMMSNS